MAHTHLSTLRPARSQWQRIESLIQRWLRERQQLVTLLCRAQGIGEPIQSPLYLVIEELCDLLMDYISAGYFEVYRELAYEARLGGADNGPLVERILRQLEDSTDEALLFNQHFGVPGNVRQLGAQLQHRLAMLTEKMEERFALEDQLIVSVHQHSTLKYHHLH